VQDEKQRRGASELAAVGMRGRRRQRDAGPAHQRGKGGEDEGRAGHRAAPKQRSAQRAGAEPPLVKATPFRRWSSAAESPQVQTRGEGLPDFIVRAIGRGDREQWAPLWRAYLDFYRTPESAEVTEATWARIFDPLEPVQAVVAGRDDELIGFSHYLFQRST